MSTEPLSRYERADMDADRVDCRNEGEGFCLPHCSCAREARWEATVQAAEAREDALRWAMAEALLALEEARNWTSKVGVESVTEEENRTAEVIITAFNRAFGTRFRATTRGNLVKVVGRLRAYPEVDLDGHFAIIESVANGPHWWRDAPGLSIIYGNDEQFERAANQVGRRPAPDDTSAVVVRDGVQVARAIDGDRAWLEDVLP